MDGAVVFEWDGERSRGDLRAIELRRRDASLHTLRVLDHNLVPGRTVAECDLEPGPGLGNAGVKTQNTAFDAKSEDAPDASALHPAG